MHSINSSFRNKFLDRIPSHDLHSECQRFINGGFYEIGYARVSSDTQDYHAQVEALKAAGCERSMLEEASGKCTNGRPQFAQLLNGSTPRDVVVVTKLDRIARSSRDLHNILR